MCKSEGNNDVRICGSCTHLPFNSSCFDSVLFLEVIEYLGWPSQYKSLSEIRRVLKPRGSIVISAC